jgi:FkbM family methyltransferase
MLVAARSIRAGVRLRDKAGIAARIGVYALSPLGTAARRLGHPLPDPTRHLAEVTVRGHAGTFVCPPSPGGFFLGADQAYEPELKRLLAATRGIVVDVGASIGFITVHAARTAEHVFAIEPHPVRFAYLERNVAANGLTNVTCINCAIGAEDGEIDLYDVDPTLGPHPLDVSTTPGPGTAYRVPLRRLDGLVSDADVVKVDVEGFELPVLRGMPKLLSRRPRLVIEVLGDPAPVRALLDGYALGELAPHTYVAEPAT